MKKLRIIEQQKEISDMSDFEKIETDSNILFPDTLKKFLLVYEGAFLGGLYYQERYSIKEILFIYKKPDFPSIEAILEGHNDFEIQGFIPFAIDSGGWDYNFSVNEESYGQVWVNKFDSGEENPMEFVSSSFEDFINGLEAEE
ncbi:SMI1/KNR4 family protein [Marinoscillum pacificum]|uniref:SMI1/KNR4 family protein n=1 Tax=Marinoscillum pacificum TaxID=392723 RepID=UPI002157F830|nr:SMI1/KNR4 family protein [Marinoscillum pacificum]